MVYRPVRLTTSCAQLADGAQRSGGPQSNAISQYVDKQFDECYNITQIEGDLPHVRFARINYMEVTYITTKWAAWKYASPLGSYLPVPDNRARRAPVLIVLTERGKSLRFYYPSTLNTKAAVLHRFLKQEAWKDQEPWSTRYAPGGDRYATALDCSHRTHVVFSEYILDFTATWMAKGYRLFNQVPRFVFLIMTGGITSLLLSFLHRGGDKPKQQQPPPPVKRANLRRVPAVIIDPNEVVVGAAAAPPPAAAGPVSTHEPKKRKGKK